MSLAGLDQQTGCECTEEDFLHLLSEFRLQQEAGEDHSNNTKVRK